MTKEEIQFSPYDWEYICKITLLFSKSSQNNISHYGEFTWAFVLHAQKFDVVLIPWGQVSSNFLVPK